MCAARRRGAFMDSTDSKRSSGQTMIQAAMLMMVLIACLVIAIDMGNILNERRRMQNAADAGALAGAWELCFGDPSMASARALEYAVDRNDAQVADVSVYSYTVTVRASEAVDTYLAGLIGVPTSDVGATAEAVCGAANLLCGIWPLSFHIERWERLACWDEGMDESVGVFYVFNDGKFEEDDMCYDELDGVCHPPCDILDPETDEVLIQGVCQCNLIPPDNDAFIVGPGHRGWLLFPRPREPYDHLAPNCTDNCGDQVRCWIDYGTYGGAVPIPNFGDAYCIPGQPGVDESVRLEIERDHVGDRPNILLWDRMCYEGEEVHGSCAGDPYHIVGMGCVTILDVLEFDLMRKEAFRPPDKCLGNVKVIKARKRCECTSACGSSTGIPPKPGEVRAVSLTK
jgi:hypothetical protein